MDFAYWVILHAILSSASFFEYQFFRKILSGLPSECQTVWIQIRPDLLSGLIWVQTLGKLYQETTLTGKELTSSHYKYPFIHLVSYPAFGKSDVITLANFGCVYKAHTMSKSQFPI